jgi:hypothetical protein
MNVSVTVTLDATEVAAKRTMTPEEAAAQILGLLGGDPATDTAAVTYVVAEMGLFPVPVPPEPA